jgi:hypothetical protein
MEHCFQFCQFQHASQQLYSPDISPCAFFLFNDLNGKLTDEEFDALQELQARVDEFLGQLTSETMQRVYEHWIERL